MEAGRWTLLGNWLERNEMPIIVKGMTLVAWGNDNWFRMVTKLIFPGSEREEITYQYRGRIDNGARQYTFVSVQHSQLLGRVEGEGWMAPETIVQRYWVVGDRLRRTGFDTLHRVSDDTYFLSGGIMAGHHLVSTMEVTLERQPESHYS